MTIVKWAVDGWSEAPQRKEYEKETAHFYTYRSGSAKVARRDAKHSLYYRFFDSEAEAVEYIRQRVEKKADQKRVDQINRCGVELLEALEMAEAMLCRLEPVVDRGGDDSVSVESEILFARAAIAKARGLA